MDLNLDNYSNIDIINLLHLPIKEKYTLQELKINTLDHVKVITSAEDDVVGDKRQVTDFFIKAIIRVYILRFNPSTYKIDTKIGISLICQIFVIIV